MIIAVFSDVHGRILQCFKLCVCWEKENNEKIDLILQAFVRGNHEDHDLGAIFPVDAYNRIFCLKSGIVYYGHTGKDFT
ncbi:MAG: hypothetical protein ACE5J3_08585 [Methanosarcinales archaeon]